MVPRASVTRQRKAGVNFNKNTQNEKVRHHSRRTCRPYQRGFCGSMYPVQRNRVDWPVPMLRLQGNRRLSTFPVGSEAVGNRGLKSCGEEVPVHGTSTRLQCCQSHPAKRSSQEHSRVDLIRASVASGGKYSPASRLCQYRVLRPVLSAICSCVIPAPARIAATFFPKRLRRRQGAGFFDGMASIVAKMESPQHEALPRLVSGCIPVDVRLENADSLGTRNPITINPL